MKGIPGNGTAVQAAVQAAVQTDGAQAIRRALSVLRYVARGRGEGERLSDIAAQAGLKIPTARRILKSLIDERMVIQVEDRRYAIGPLAAELGLAYRRDRTLPRATTAFIATVRQLAAAQKSPAGA